MKGVICFVISGHFLICACTKDIGKNPSLAYSDRALLDSCKNINYTYYKNDPANLLTGSAGPHGTFKLRFNSIAQQALNSDGKLEIAKVFPNGSMLVKDIYKGNNLYLYAYMYKKNGTWLWAEIEPNGNLHYSVTRASDVCVNCHNQQGNRDLVMSFKFY